jgi:hypothetical protein
MAFDVEGYRKAAKEAGFSDEEIQKDIDEETQGIAAKGADANMANVKVGKDFMGIPEYMQPAAAVLSGVALGGLGLKGAQKIKERMNAPQQPTARVEPTFGIPDVEAFAQPQNTFTPPKADITDVASRPVGADRTQIAGPATMPEGPVAPPGEANAVQPLTDKQRREKAMADLAEHKLEEARKASAAKEAAQAESKKQTTTSSGGVSPQDRQMLNSSENAKIDKALAAQQKPVAPPAPAPVAPAPAPTPVATPVVTAPAPVAAMPESMPAVPPVAATEAPTKAVAETPEGRIPAYANPKRNKQGKDVIGQGGWHWYQGQMGPEAEKNWLSTFGRTNQSYADVKQAMKEGRLKGPDVVEGKGGAFPRETHVPNYVKGNASIKGLAGLAASIGLLGMAGSEKGQAAMEKASQAIKDLGISPDIFTNKGEELGNLGRAYVNAGNPNYKRELLQKIESTNDPEFKKLLQLELTKLSGPSGAVPPPKR